MTDFYRVENYWHEGPYTTTSPDSFPVDKVRHPVPTKDGFDYREFPKMDDPVFGFSSLEQLKAWMLPEILPTLEKKYPGEFLVSHYTVNTEYPHAIIYGGHQAIASPYALTTVSAVRLPDFLKEIS